MNRPLRLHIAALTSLLALVSAPHPASAADTASAAATDGVIIKIRPPLAEALNKVSTDTAARLLSDRLGLPLTVTPGPAPNMRLVRSPKLTTDALAKHLQQDSDIEYAAPNRRMKLLRR